MEPRNIIAGQDINREKLFCARQLRSEMTPAELELWSKIRNRLCGGYKFRRQQIIDGFIADFYCAEVGLVIELDGPIHDRQAEYDKHRDAVFAQRKLTVLRIPNPRVLGEIDTVLSEIVTLCRNPAISLKG